MKQKKLSWLIRSLFVLPAVCGTAQAETAAQEAAQATAQQVVVTGIRAATRSALAVKESSNSIVEVIASEDIGKLPDTTIAESLARLPGLSSGIDRGNASQVNARGMGPRLLGALLNGRELASSEPNRAVRFEQFPSESLTGAIVYKTQNADLVEGGIATTVDLQTVQPLRYKGAQFSLKADALYYALAREMGAKAQAPRLGGIYIDQFLDNTLGVAVAFSYQDQPSVTRRVEHYGFNETNSGTPNTPQRNNPKYPWGFGDSFKRGKNERSSVLGKVEWKPSSDLFVTGDVYYARADIHEQDPGRWLDGVGNWDGGQNADYSNVTTRNGYVTGGTVKNVGFTTNDALWTQDMDTWAGGLNIKQNSGEWKLETDVSYSQSERKSQWSDLRLHTKAGATVNYLFLGDENPSYSFGQNTASLATYDAPQLYVDAYGHVKDALSGVHFNASRALDFGPVQRLKVGARATYREKSYRQLSWSVLSASTAPASSAYETVHVDDQPDWLMLKDFRSSVTGAFGPSALDPAGRTQNDNDKLASWKVTEETTAAYAMADLGGEMFGKTYRGNAGVRLVHTRQSGAGTQASNSGTATTLKAVKEGTKYTEVLPSANLIFMMDAKEEQQLRVGVARAMSRAPIDEMRGSRNITEDAKNPTAPTTGSAGNPQLLPMMANQVDLSYQWYFGKGNLLSAGAFYKNVQRYIGIEFDKNATINGRAAQVTRSVNREGGDIRGLEFVYQQAFTSLPAPYDGLGVFSNYAYTTSNIKESDTLAIEGLMKHNAGFTVWYEKEGYEARLSANYHSAFVRTPSWTAGAFITNDAEKYVTLGLSKQLNKNFQLRFGIDNLTNQKVVYTSSNDGIRQDVREFGRRFNLGLSYKM
ncbi:MAG: TonB-dependent receptor [Massilia sp.]